MNIQPHSHHAHVRLHHAASAAAPTAPSAAPAVKVSTASSGDTVSISQSAIEASEAHQEETPPTTK